jgi:DNA polymerase elongation subunit (family B)
VKTAVFDIETSALEAIGSGIILCACIRPLSTGRTRTYRIDAYKYEPDPLFGIMERQEKDLVVDVLKELGQYDLLIGQNIENFDLGFLKSRASRLGIPFTLAPLTYDTMKAWSRTKFRTVMNFVGKPSRSLDMITDFLGITQEKTKIYPAEHWQTIWGNELQRIEAMNNLVDHCQRDVRMNTKVYEMELPADNRVIIKRWL